MANGQQWYNTTRLRDAFGVYGHAMPSSLVKQCTGINNGPICFIAEGINVPISRGSPPISG
jgi:hypothetical protein